MDSCMNFQINVALFPNLVRLNTLKHEISTSFPCRKIRGLILAVEARWGLFLQTTVNLPLSKAAYHPTYLATLQKLNKFARKSSLQNITATGFHLASTTASVQTIWSHHQKKEDQAQAQPIMSRNPIARLANSS